MKKVLLLLLTFVLIFSVYAATPPAERPVPNAREMMLPIGNTGQMISLMDLSRISVKDFEALKGKKLSLFGKIGFKLKQKNLRNKINDDGTFTGKALQEIAGKMASNDGFHAGGFFLGLLLNVWAIPIVYLMKDENRKRRIKSMWIGLATAAGLVLLFALLLGLSGF